MEVEKTKSKFDVGDEVLFLGLFGIYRGKISKVNPVICLGIDERKFDISFKYEVGYRGPEMCYKEIAEKYLFRDKTELQEFLFK